MTLQPHRILHSKYCTELSRMQVPSSMRITAPSERKRILERETKRQQSSTHNHHQPILRLSAELRAQFWEFLARCNNYILFNNHLHCCKEQRGSSAVIEISLKINSWQGNATLHQQCKLPGFISSMSRDSTGIHADLLSKYGRCCAHEICY